jgi:dTDP-4-dehydrorhamnose reductase
MSRSLPEVWAGPECSWLHVGEWRCDQVALTGHDRRPEDLDALAGLGVRAVRYPVLWGRTEDPREATDWAWAEARLGRLAQLGVRPIVGLLHHGFGPEDADPLDPGWPAAFGRYAAEVARRFPAVTEFLPVNEPLTTARFAGLYGWWPPYGRDHDTFVRLVLAQAEAHVAAARAIRTVNPDARILVNEDLGRTVGGPGCEAAARRDTERRWWTFDLLNGRVHPGHALWQAAKALPRGRRILDGLRLDPDVPDVLGIDYYVTSDRYLDGRLDAFPPHSHGGDGSMRYADVELVRVAGQEIAGFDRCIGETWARYGRPLALTEVHLAGEPDDQVAWWAEAMDAAEGAVARGVPVLGVTAWAAFGAFDWSSVLRHPVGSYASGCFDERGFGALEVTALGRAVRAAASGQRVGAPRGWWRHPERVIYDLPLERRAA